MPTVSFYLRNEDYDKWRKLEKPGEFIHNALNSPKTIAEAMATMDKHKNPTSFKPINYTDPDGLNHRIYETKPPKEDPQFADKYAIIRCRHGADPKYCKHAKNGKKCK